MDLEVDWPAGQESPGRRGYVGRAREFMPGLETPGTRGIFLDSPVSRNDQFRVVGRKTGDGAFCIPGIGQSVAVALEPD